MEDTNPTIDKIAAADMILFATPVYWWGMSAQLKLIIDKCYCRGLQLKNKKVGTIVVGGSPVGSIQYELIDKSTPGACFGVVGKEFNACDEC